MVSAVPLLPSVEGNISPWQCENGPRGWAPGLPSICPGKQWRLGLNHVSYTWHIFLCLFWNFLTSRPFFCGTPWGPGQNKHEEPLHAWDKRSDHWFLVFQQGFFFFLLFLWELMLHWLSGMSSDLHGAPSGKKISRRACISGCLCCTTSLILRKLRLFCCMGMIL